jgi:hypothetical protein
MNSFIGIGLILSALVWYFLFVNNQKPRRLAIINSYKFNPAIIDRLHRRFPELSNEQIRQIIQGLRDYLALCYLAKGDMLIMPSRIVDEAWHEFILFSREYSEFCPKVFGRFLHHNPTETIAPQKVRRDAFILAWKLSCEMANINSQKPAELPLLFRIDKELVIPGGLKFQLSFDPNHYKQMEMDSSNADVPSCGA